MAGGERLIAELGARSEVDLRAEGKSEERDIHAKGRQETRPQRRETMRPEGRLRSYLLGIRVSGGSTELETKR